MKILIAFVFAILLQSNAFTQSENDSLLKVWNNTNYNDSLRVNAMHDLINNYLYSKIDTALILANTLLSYSQNKKNIELEIEAMAWIGDVYFEMDEVSKGEGFYRAGLEIAKSLEDSSLFAEELFNLGKVYLDREDFPNAFKTFQESRIVSKAAGDSSGEAWSIGYMGLINLDLENWGEAEKYFLEHLQISRKYNDKYGESGAKGNLGGVYERTKRYDQALEYWKAGIKIAKEGGWKQYASIGTTALIRIYIVKKQYSKAIEYLNEYREVTKNYTSIYYRVRIHLYQCQIDYGLGNYSKALKEGNTCLTLLKADESSSYSKDLFEILYKTNKELGQSIAALEYYEKYQFLEDSLRNDNKKTEFQRYLFNTQLVTDSIEQAKEKEILNASYTEEIRRKNLEKNALLAIGLMVLLLAVGMYHRLRFVRKSKEKLNIEKERAEKSEQIKQDFLANMSHEIRTPMNAVLGMTNLVLDTPLNEKQRYYLDGIKKSGDNLLYIINDILDLSKIEAGKMELDEIDFSLRDSIDQIIQMLQHRASDKGLALLSNVDPKVEDLVIGDPMRLNQILINLIGNAIKFTPKGSVTLEVKNVNNDVQFNIIDTGIGIPEDKLQAVFESFSQANSSDTRKYGGTGLGLSISQHLVAMMNGTITIQSKEGYGTTFSFIIHFKKGSIDGLNQRIAKDETIDGSILNGLKILLVDDNEYNIIVARDTLKSKAKLDIIEAYNGEEAIALVRENTFDLILMDVQMPIMNGFDATLFIRNNFDSPTKDIPIIALTASVLRVDLDKCIDSGMNSYIPKPFKANQLIGEIAEVLTIPLIKAKEKTATPEPENDNGEVSNLNYLNKFCDNDKERIKKYIGLFISSTPLLFEKINSALIEDDFEEIAAQVHGFKTKCMMMGMTKTIETSNALELLCRENPDEKLIKEEVNKLLINIEKASLELNDYIENESI